MTIQNPKKTILYVEDNYIIQMTVVSFLSEQGFEFLVANNADHALHYIFDETLTIDALLTDVNLGAGLTGWEVARCARLQRPEMPVIYTSSVDEAEWIANAVPFSRLCTKPFRPSHVLGALASLLSIAVEAVHAMPGLISLPPAELVAAGDAAIAATGLIAVAASAPYARSLPIGRQPWVVGPLGQRLYKRNLPRPNCQWTSRRKAEVVAAFTGGLVSSGELQDIYDLSVEEFAGWQRAVDRFGMAGLRQTRVQHYRESQQRTQRFGWAG